MTTNSTTLRGRSKSMPSMFRSQNRLSFEENEASTSELSSVERQFQVISVSELTGCCRIGTCQTLSGEMEVEGTAGNTRRFHDRVDIRRICTGTLELHDRSIQHPRPRLAALGFATRLSVWHVPILQHPVSSLTDIT
jgi:hypothetical protein